MRCICGFELNLPPRLEGIAGGPCPSCGTAITIQEVKNVGLYMNKLAVARVLAEDAERAKRKELERRSFNV